MAKFSTYAAAGAIDADSDVLLIGQEYAGDVVLKTTTPLDVVNAAVDTLVDTADGLCGLDSGGKVAMGNLPGGVSEGVATLGLDGKVPTAQLPARVIGIASWCAGKPGNSELVLGGVAIEGFTISGSNSNAKASVAATASTVFTLKNGSTTVGTFTFSASGTTCTLSISGSATVVAGDFLTVTGPATADTTLANISFQVRN